MTSDMPDIENMDKLAEWFDKDTLELIGHILNKHTKSCLSELKNLAYEKKELKRRLSEAEAKMPRWIPVSERLPKPATMCLVIEEGDIEIAYFTPSSRWASETLYNRKVTHWMPLPEVPESGKGE